MNYLLTSDTRKQFALALLLGWLASSAHAQTTAIAYQGSLSENGPPATGLYDFQFKVFNQGSGGSQVSSTLTLGNQLVSNGLFTVSLDFGSNVFNGSDRWLEISTRPGASTEAYTTLTPRQRIISVPYAVRAANFNGTVDASQIRGSLSSNHLGAASITTLALADGAVTPDKIGGVLLPAQIPDLDAAKLVSGLLPDARIAPTVARLNVSQTFTAPTALGSGAQLLSDAGSAAAPGLSFNGDADTGWFRPAANSVALATTGAERLRVDASGNVGVGTAAPTAPLEVNGAVKATSFTGSGGGLTGLNPANLAAGVVPTAVTFANAASTFAGSFSGDGSGLAGLNALQLTGPFTVSSEIFRTGAYSGGGNAVGLVISGNLAFVAMYSSGLFILDISDETNPRLVGSYDSPGFALAVAVSGRYAYLADESAGVQIIDILNPASPVRVGGYNTSGKAYDVAVSGTHLYIADESQGLLVLDVSNPTLPSYVGAYNTSGLALGLALSTPYAYVADHSGGLQIINVNDPANPVRVGGYVTIGGARNVAVSGPYAYVADQTGGLQILDINNPASPQRVGGFATPGAAIGVAVSDNRVYVADNSGSSLSVIDVSNPSNPTLITNLPAGGEGHDVAVHGPHAYVAAGFGLQVFTTGTASAPRFVGNGSGLTSLDASRMTLGTLPDGRLSPNVALLGTAQAFSADKFFVAGAQVFADPGTALAPGVAFNGDANTGVFLPSPNTLAFTATGVERMRLSDGGFMGIGTSAPEARLHVVDSSAGAVTPNANSAAVFERAANCYVSLLAPLANETGILFGNPNGHPLGGSDGGIIFNNSSAPHGLQFRTGTNGTRMTILADGSVGIGTTSPANKLHVVGGVSATAFVTTSDRNAKEEFQPVSPSEVLAKVARLTINRWRFKDLRDGSHLGPTAQDFHAAFGLGSSETGIATVDADGVALAAIQGLNQRLTEELKRRDAENADLKRAVQQLQQIVSNLSNIKP